MSDNTIFELPAIDEDGYFCGFCTCMNDPSTGEPLLPPDVINTTAPETDDKHWYKWDGSAWVAETKPTTCEELIAFGAISHTSQTARFNELRQICQTLTTADLEHYHVNRGDNLEWIVEAVPEKTEEEKAAEEKAQKIAELKKKLADTDYVAAKIAEGAATKEEYADILAQRAEWREEINKLESEE